jgi:hypothetical protein
MYLLILPPAASAAVVISSLMLYFRVSAVIAYAAEAHMSTALTAERDRM